MKIQKLFTTIIFFAMLTGIFCLLSPAQRTAAREEGETKVTARVISEGADQTDLPEISASPPTQTKKEPSDSREKMIEQGNVVKTGDSLDEKRLVFSLLIVLSFCLLISSARHNHNSEKRPAP